MKLIFRLLAILASFALLFAAYGGRVSPMVWTLPSLATLALPAVALVVLVLLALLALCRQWRSATIVVAALLLSWPTLKLISPLHLFAPGTSDNATRLKVLTMNVTQFNWQDNNDKPSQTMRFILDEDADIVALQEGLVYFSFEQQRKLRPFIDELYKKYPYRKKHFYDVGLLSKYPFTEVESPLLAHDSLNYFIKAWDIEAPSGTIRVVNMHLSSLRFTNNDSRILDAINRPSGRKKRLNSVMRKLDGGFKTHVRQARVVRALVDDTPGDVLVMGDMNDTPGSFAYRTICGEDLLDAWAGAGLGPTYTYNAHHLFVKIDHILYRGGLKVTSCERLKAGESDHYPLVAVFERE